MTARDRSLERVEGLRMATLPNLVSLVRLLLVPAVLYLVGERAWWLPRWADRMLPDVRFAH